MRGDSGSTFVEVLAALAVLSVIGAVLWFSGGTAADGLQRAVRVRRVAVETLRFQRSLSRYAERVRPPYWMGECFAEGIDGLDQQIRVAYLDRREAAWLEVANGSRGLFIETSDGDSLRFPRLRASEIFLLSEAGVAYGIAVLVSPESAEADAIPVVAGFGATTVPSAGAPSEDRQ